MHKFLLLFMFVMAATGAATVFIYFVSGGCARLHDYFRFLRQLRYVLPMLAINSRLVVLNTQ